MRLHGCVVIQAVYVHPQMIDDAFMRNVTTESFDLVFSVSEVNLERHVSCEPCNEGVNGGFDPQRNQVGLSGCEYF